MDGIESCKGKTRGAEVGDGDPLAIVPPRSDEFELTLLGPGYGECVAIHYGHGEWIVVDSCLDEDGRPAALTYLRELNVDVRSAVRRVVVTHWHDDHIRGIAQVVRECAMADFVCPAGFKSPEFLTLVQSYADGAMMEQSGLNEMSETLAIVNSNARTVLLALENRLLLQRDCLHRPRSFKLWALSPSDAAIKWALASLGTKIPQPMASKTAVSPPTPNHLSIALLAQLEDRAMLLGADVHCSDSRSLGWLRIADIHREYSHATAEVLKVPHHGSSNSDTAELWDRLVVPNPIAALTSFRRGNVSLPKGTDVSRIESRTNEAYITSLPRRSRPVRRDRSVEKTVECLLRDRRRRLPKPGRVTLRRPADGSTNWSVHLAGAACRLSSASFG